MENRLQRPRAEFTPQIEELKAMWHQDVAAARVRLAEHSSNLSAYVARDAIKALGIAFGAGVILGWLIRRR